MFCSAPGCIDAQKQDTGFLFNILGEDPGTFPFRLCCNDQALIVLGFALW